MPGAACSTSSSVTRAGRSAPAQAECGAVGLRLALVIGALVLGLAVPAGGAAPARDLAAYGGLGTWVDVWDVGVWKSPEAAVATMQAYGVTTLYLETSSYSRPVDLVRPAALGRFLDAAHEAGIRVVAWYLPSFANGVRDLRRSLAAIGFRSANGETFDSFALDIEASVVKPPAKRTARVLALARGLRAAAGAEYTLGAIIPSPRAMDLRPKYWPGFPYVQLAETFDVFLPMGYFTYRFKTAAASLDYTQASVELLRERTGDEALAVHAIGGLARTATTAQVRAFARASLEAGATGGSLYDYADTKPAQWQALAALVPVTG
jgi:hypothetical protein